MKNWFNSITGGIAFYFIFGFLLIGWRVAAPLFDYEAGYAADIPLPALVALWMLCLPVFILICVSIEMILEFLGIFSERINFR